MKNKNAQALGRLSAKKRKTNYSELGKKSWAKLTPKQRKEKLKKLHDSRRKKNDQ